MSNRWSNPKGSFRSNPPSASVPRVNHYLDFMPASFNLNYHAATPRVFPRFAISLSC
jgi:hypothetical protein